MDLSDWLLCDHWTYTEAALLLAGINPDGTSQGLSPLQGPKEFLPGTIVLLDGTPLETVQPLPIPAIIDDIVVGYLITAYETRAAIEERRLALGESVRRFYQLLERSELPPIVSPQAVVEWAISKNFQIPWLEAAAHSIKPRQHQENPDSRRQRLMKRVRQEKAKGTTAFLKVVAAEEGISVPRLKQLVYEKPEPANKWTAMLPNVGKTSSKKTKPKS